MATTEAAAVKEVWAANVMEEVPLILTAAQSFPFVAVDTEFSGFLRHTTRYASMEEQYRDVKYNVERMELVQLGFTVFDLQLCPQYTWQINVACRTDNLPPSVKLRRKSGIDLEKNRDEGVDVELLSDILLGSGSFQRCSGRTWVTFHGIYDLAFLVKLMSHSTLPENPADFALLAGAVLGSVVDTKHIARFCGEGFRAGDLSLVKLSQLLRVRLPGVILHHQAGHDSLLTAMTFQKMFHRFRHALQEVELEGFLWGMEGYRIRQPEQQQQQVDVDDGDSSFVTIVPVPTHASTAMLLPAPFQVVMMALPLSSPWFF